MLLGNRNHLIHLTTSLVLFFGLTSSAPKATGETWTGLRGVNSFEAKFIGLWGEDKVVLQLSDGRRRTIKLDKFRGDSRIQARNLAKKRAADRASRIRELKAQAASINSAAPSKQLSPPPAPAYSPPKKDAAIGEFVKQVNESLSGGHLRVLYDFRPPSYRKDIADIIKLAANKTSPESFQATTNVSYRLGDLIVTRRNWLFSSPRFGNFEPAERDKAKWTLLGLAYVLQKGLSPEVTALETFQTKDFETWLDRWDKTVAPYVAEMVKKADIDFDNYTRVVSEGEGTATISTGAGESPVQVDLVLIEGFWVSTTVAESWTADVATAKEKIAAIPAGKFMEPQAMMASIVAASLDSIADAKTADQYHDALDSILSQADSTASFQQVLASILSPIQTIITAASNPTGTEATDGSVPE
jgi:hypothetical protein